MGKLVCGLYEERAGSGVSALEGIPPPLTIYRAGPLLVNFSRALQAGGNQSLTLRSVNYIGCKVTLRQIVDKAIISLSR